METPLDLDFFLDLETEAGWKVRDFLPLNGHHLVYKIPLSETVADSPIILPKAVQKKAVKNLTMIRGFVIRASAPWGRKRPVKRVVWDNETGSWSVKWDLRESSQCFPSDLPSGACVLYNSYNVGQVKVRGLEDPLVVVREIDVDAVFQPEEIERVCLGSRAMK